MKTGFYISFLFGVVILFCCMNCKKNSKSCTGGGKGGNATLVVTPVHFGLNVDSCMVYIKYATNDAPANDIYDDSGKVFRKDTTPIAVFTKLKTGQYYIFGDGYHRTYASYVKGGIPITICIEDSNNVLLPTGAYLK